jgi:hypothetical protein
VTEQRGVEREEEAMEAKRKGETVGETLRVEAERGMEEEVEEQVGGGAGEEEEAEPQFAQGAH